MSKHDDELPDARKDTFQRASKKYYRLHRDEIIVKSQIYYNDNREAILARARVYRERNRDRIKEYQRMYREKNRARIRKRQREQYAERQSNTDYTKKNSKISSQKA